MLSRFAGSRPAGPRTKGENALKQDLTNQLVETGVYDSSEASYLTLNSKPQVELVLYLVLNLGKIIVYLCEDYIGAENL